MGMRLKKSKRIWRMSLVALSLLLAAQSLTLTSCTPSDKTPAQSDGERADVTGAETDCLESDGETKKETEPMSEQNTEPLTEPETAATTEGETEKEEETEQETEPYADDSMILLYDFSNIPESLDWSATPFGIDNPLLQTGNDGLHVDAGDALQVTLPSEAAWCQSLTVSVSGWESRKYLRLWVDNMTGGVLSVGLTLYTGNQSSAACPMADGARIYTANGKPVICTVNDCSGMGAGVSTSVELPAGFRGWVAFPADQLTPRRDEPFLDGTPVQVNIDLRPSGFSAGESYMLDELVLSDRPDGRPRGEDIDIPLPAGLAEKQAQIQHMMTLCQTESVVFCAYPAYDPDGEYEGIHAIAYEGVDRNGKKTRVFAYVGYPEGADSTTPAIVLVHGGGGHAFLPWMKLWMDRGYAVIAPDVTGYFPDAKNAGADETQNGWVYGLHGVFSADGYLCLPNNDGMSHSSSAVEDQWMYHALAATAKAFSLLEQSGKCDPGKIGVTGISWGGVITSLYIGYDSRPAFAIPVYGTAYLDEALSWIKDNFAGADTRALWSAADRLDRVRCPILWLVWNDDNCFSLNSASKSYLATKDIPGTRLAAVNGMLHGHSAAWVRPESYAFADSVVGTGDALPLFVTLPTSSGVSCTVENGRRARLYYLTEDMTYSVHEKYGYESTFMDQTWKTANLTLSGDGCVTGQIPADAVVYYIEISVPGGIFVTSPLVYTK